MKLNKRKKNGKKWKEMKVINEKKNCAEIAEKNFARLIDVTQNLHYHFGNNHLREESKLNQRMQK